MKAKVCLKVELTTESIGIFSQVKVLSLYLIMILLNDKRSNNICGGLQNGR